MAQTYERTCKLASCSKEFRTKRKSQEFCKAKCRQQAFMQAKYKAEYERGKLNMAKLIWDMCLRESKDVIGTSEIMWASGLQRACTLIEQEYPEGTFQAAKGASA